MSDKLTMTEMRILEEAKKPQCRKDIAKIFNVEKGTIAFHLNNIYRKLGCKDRMELIYRYKTGG